MRSRLRVLIASAMLMTLMAVGPAANAQPPTNDDIGNATVVTEPLPYVDEIDTSEATGSPDDPGCVAEPGDPNNPTVWYSYTPGEDGFVQANTFGSNYDTTLSAYVDEGGELVQLACNDDVDSLQSAIIVEVSAGQPILFMVGAFAGQPIGDSLVFTVQPSGPPLQLDLAVERVGHVEAREGTVTLHVTVFCSEPAPVQLFAGLRQRLGRFIINGFGDSFVECEGETPVEVIVSGENGLFTGGNAEASVEAFSFGPSGEVFAFVEQNVRLRGAPRR